jgi:hypothetical protein
MMAIPDTGDGHPALTTTPPPPSVTPHHRS